MSERMRRYEVLECFGVRCVMVSHINIEITTGKHMFPRNHHGFNIVTNIMDRLDRRTRWTIKATKSKGRVEQPNVIETQRNSTPEADAPQISTEQGK